MNNKRVPIKKRIRLTIFKTISYSFIATLIIVSLIYFIISSIDDRLYANYYENQIPDISFFINNLDGEFLQSQELSQTIIEGRIPLEGMDYQIMDREGNIIYGSTDEELSSSRVPLAQKVNTTEQIDNLVITHLPITDQDDQLLGSLLLRYKIESELETFFRIVFVLTLLIPFTFIIFFTYFYGSRLGRDIHLPIQELINATESINKRDLNIKLPSHVNNEIGDLIRAFQLMKDSLNHSLKKQWKLEQSRTEFVTSVAHDIKTPLTIMQSNVQLLERKTELSNKKYTKTIQKQVERVNGLIEEFKKVQDMENPVFSLVMREVDPKTFFLSELKHYSSFLESKEINYQIIERDVRNNDTNIKLDEERLRQVLDNIISNSIRFVSSGGSIRCYIDHYNDYTEVVIKDDGPGFPPRDLTLIFEKYYQVEYLKGNGHHGFGLYIVKNIIQAHKGKVRAWNEEGACVAFLLPCK